MCLKWFKKSKLNLYMVGLELSLAEANTRALRLCGHFSRAQGLCFAAMVATLRSHAFCIGRLRRDFSLQWRLSADSRLLLHRAYASNH